MSARKALALFQQLHDAGRFADQSSEQVLAAYAASRDEGAFRVLLHRHAGPVWAACRRELTCPDLAEDAFQATFLALVRQARQIRGDGSVAGWLDKTAKRTAIAMRRKEARRIEIDAAKPPPDGRPPSDADRARLVTAAVADLPEKYRLPLEYRFFGGLSAAEVAKALGVPEETGRTRVKRGLELLRVRLADRGLAIVGGVVGSEAALNAAREPLPFGLLAVTLKAVVRAEPARGGLLAAVLAAVTYKRAAVGMILLAGGMTGALYSSPESRKGAAANSSSTRPFQDSTMRRSPILAFFAALGLTPTSQAQIFTNLVNSSTPIPGGTGNFTNLGAGPIDGTTMVFVGLGSNSQIGIYTVPTTGGPLTVIADIQTPIPNGTGTFTTFNNNGFFHPFAISGSNVVFAGRATGQAGIYYGSNKNSLIRIADLNTPIPGGTGNFAAFNDGGVALSGSTITFVGNPHTGSGIYTGTTAGGPLNRLVDSNTPIPNGTGNFTSANRLSDSGTTAAFAGVGTNQQVGIYTVSTLGGPVTHLVNRTTPLPNGAGNFSNVSHISISNTTVVFNATGTGANGIYSVPAVGGAVTVIADTNTPIPGGTGNFTGSFGVTSLNGTTVAFRGNGSNGQGGIYSASTTGGPVTKIVAIGDTIDGRTVNSFGFGLTLNDGSIYAFRAGFTNGTQAVYTFTPVPEPATGLAAAAAVTLLALGRWLTRGAF